MTTGTAWQEAADVVPAQRRTLRVLSTSQIVGGIGFGAGLSVGILLAEDVTSVGGLGRSRAHLDNRRCRAVGGAVGAGRDRLGTAAGARRWLGTGRCGSVLLMVAAMAGHGPAATVALVLGMTASGAGSATTLQTRYAATDLAPPRHRSRQLSLVVWATTVGAVLGPNLGAPGEAVGRWLGIAPMAGPFVIAAAVQLLAVATISFLRPDPLLLAADRNGVGRRDAATPRRRGSLRRSITMAWDIPPARLALVSICSAHSVMVGVMTMTPVHMDHEGATITVVGLTISLHILGMYGLSPLVGAAADRFGRPPMIAVGMVVLLLATVVAGTAGASAVQVTVGLFLLGVGWSLCLVAASALLTESVPAASRTEVQGAADAAMNISAAIGAAASGPLLGIIGFGGLNALSAAIVLVAAPWVVAGLRTARTA